MERIRTYLKKIQIELSDEQTEQLYRFYQLVLEKNKVLNLTTITDYEEFLYKHLADSLIIESIVDSNFNNNSISSIKVLDLGTGAGFPGIPLAIVHPEWELVLLDSLHKRVRFLEEVVAELALSKVHPIHSRAEDLAHQKEYREQFDLCVSRAVANLSTLSEYAIPFIRVGGCFLSYKGPAADDEIQAAKYAIKQLGGHLEKVETYTLPDTDITHSIVQIQKIKSTYKKYPRKAGTPSKEPLENKGKKAPNRPSEQENR